MFILCHQCCDHGLLRAKKWLEDNGHKVVFKRKNIFQCKDEKLDQKYQFDLNSLYSKSYLCNEEKVLVVFK